MAVDTKKVIGRRSLHFASLDEILAEAERLAAGRHRQLGNWTLGQILMHLARAGEAYIDGTPDRPGWLFIKSADGKMTRPRWFLRILGVLTVPFLQWYLRRWGPPPGIRPPAILWKEVAALVPKEGPTTEADPTSTRTWAEIEAVSIADPVPTEVGLAALRKATSRLKSESTRDLEGIMTQETFDLYHLRHAEMHLSFIVPEDREGQAASVAGPSALARLFVFAINGFNRCAEGMYNLLHRPSRRTKRCT